jgi:hypothetical protein
MKGCRGFLISKGAGMSITQMLDHEHQRIEQLQASLREYIDKQTQQSGGDNHAVELARELLDLEKEHLILLDILARVADEPQTALYFCRGWLIDASMRHALTTPTFMVNGSGNGHSNGHTNGNGSKYANGSGRDTWWHTLSRSRYIEHLMEGISSEISRRSTVK